jgi:hypothetical protein
MHCDIDGREKAGLSAVISMAIHRTSLLLTCKCHCSYCTGCSSMSGATLVLKTATCTCRASQCLPAQLRHYINTTLIPIQRTAHNALSLTSLHTQLIIIGPLMCLAGNLACRRSQNPSPGPCLYNIWPLIGHLARTLNPATASQIICYMPLLLLHLATPLMATAMYAAARRFSFW